MRTKVLISVWLLFTARTFAATALHHYAFNNSGVDDSIGTTNGTLVGGATLVGGRLNLDGSTGYVQFNQHIVPTTGSFSIAFFAQEVSPQPTYTEIVSQGASMQLGFYVGYDPYHKVWIGDALQNTDIPFPSDGLLYHYAVTATTTDTRFYIDGYLIATFGPISMTSSGGGTRLGQQYDPYKEFFHGNIDEFWVYSGALTPDEVSALAGRPRLMIEILPGQISSVRLCWNSATNFM